MQNIKSFFIIWLVVLLLNQIILFHACFTQYCIASALPHTSIISLFVMLLLYFKDKKVESNMVKNKDSSCFVSKTTMDASSECELNVTLTPHGTHP